MEDILNIIGKKNTINGKFNINIDDDFREKSFTITADSKYFKSKNISVELSSFSQLDTKLYSPELESISIWLIADNTILFKKINKDKLKTDDTYKEIILELTKINPTFKYITYIINENRQIFIFHEGKKDGVETLVNTNDKSFKNITEDFQNNSLLYELNNRIKKL
jgi:hypothetical protein